MLFPISSRRFSGRTSFLIPALYTRTWVQFFVLAIFLTNTINAQSKRFSFTQPKMGSPFTIVLFAGDSMQAVHLADDCFRLVDSFNFIFSDYIDTSELSRLSATAGVATQPVPVSPALLDMLLASQMAFNKSSGAFDISIGPLSKFWRKARKSKQFPSTESIQSVKKLVGLQNMMIDTVGKTVRLLRQGMQLDLGGIAQGWIGQKVIDRLRAHGIDHALVNVSGDIIMSGAPPNSKGWIVGVNVPETTDDLLPKNLLLQNMAVTTSGDAYQFMEHNGKKYSHIIDPRTGYGVTFQRNVTAIAHDGVTADWLATACSILSIKKAKKLARQLGAEVMIAEINNGQIAFHATRGFAAYWKQ